MPKKGPDKLSREAAMALAEGMSYGKWKALHSSPPRQPEPPRVKIKRICDFCGKEFIQYDRRQRKYCCEEHRIAANERKRYYAEKGGKNELEI